MIENVEDRIKHFYSNWEKKHGSKADLYAHNVYHIETVDRDGNTTGEAFGLNVFTYRTMRDWLGLVIEDDEKSYGTELGDIFVGNGCSPNNPPKFNDKAMFNSLGGPAVRSKKPYEYATKQMARAMEWDSNDQISHCTIFVCEGYFDYTAGPNNVELNEIGVSAWDVQKYYGGRGNSPTNLSLHAIMYDANGDFGGIVKHGGERLYVRVYLVIAAKPQLLHNKFETTYGSMNAVFAADPWTTAFISGKINQYDLGPLKQYASMYTCYPRTYTPTTGGYKGDVYGRFRETIGSNPRNFTATESFNPDQTTSSSPYIVTHRFDTSVETLMDAGDAYVDMGIIIGDCEWQRQTDLGCECTYCNLFAAVLPIQLDRDEVFEDVPMYVDGITDNSIVLNYGIKPYRDEFSKEEKRRFIKIDGNLPIVDFKVTAIKSYNGITHAWDISEALLNATTNDYMLSSHYLYPWVFIRIHTEIQYTGDCSAVIWFNHWTNKPVKSLDRDIKMFATDAWWDPSTWVRIDDCFNIPDAVGSKRYFITCDGYRRSRDGGYVSATASVECSSGTQAPIVVTRGNEIKPAVDLPSNTMLYNMDQVADLTSANNSFANTIAAGDPCRHVITCESRGYIWMSNTIYYPSEDVSHPIETTESLSNMNQPSACARFTEPSGQRILQIFRADNVSDNNITGSLKEDEKRFFRPRLSKVSVFDIPSATEIAADPTLTPTETLITMPNCYPDDLYMGAVCNIDITSTEEGHVVFCHRTENRADVVNLLGTPGVTQLINPNTNQPLRTNRCWAIKYTNYVVARDMDWSSDTDWKYYIIDLTDNSIYQEFEISKSLASGVRYIRGWKNFLYIVLYHSGETTLDVLFYDMTKSAANRLSDPVDVSDGFKYALIPGGAFLNTYSMHTNVVNWSDWYRMMCSHTFGDRDCFLVYRNTDTTSGGNSKYNIPIYYVDADYPLQPLNIQSNYYRITKKPRMFKGYDYFKYNAYGELERGASEDDWTAYEWYEWRRMHPWTVLSSNSFGYGATSSTTGYVIHGIGMHVGTFNQGKQRILSVNFNGSDHQDIPYTTYFDLNLIRDTREVENIKNDFYYETNNFANSTIDTDTCGKWCSFIYDGNMWICEYDSSNRNRCNKATITISSPTRFLPHRMTGTTRTIQAYNDPKNIHSLSDFSIEFINDPNIWGPSPT